ncbi:MAG: SLBB domain-containing protein [Ginsengibacter sp.]
MRTILRLFFCVLFITCGITSYSQDILTGKDLSHIRVDQLSDAEIIKYQQQLMQSGISEAQAEQIALAKGLPAFEIAKLHQRLAALTENKISGTNQLNRVTDRNNSNQVTDRSNSITQANSTESIQVNSKIFGYELFSTASLSFQPDLKIATPVNYKLGPDDELQIAVYGLQEASFNLTVSPEGTIFIPNVGEIKISGYTIEEARDRIRKRMTFIYSSLRSGGSRLSINLGKIRSIRVTLLGSAKPGTYTVSSLSTVFNALFLSGGPGVNGSFREIELIRQNKVEKKIDLYNFLLSGSEADNVRLEENDIIRIPIYKNRVDIEGEIKRPGIFEMLPGETLLDLIRFASGFTDNAFKASIKVIQLTDKEKRVQDINQSEYVTYSPRPGDFFQVSTILNRFQNRVTVSGAVFRPGIFEITPNLTLGQLIKNADGLREDAYTKRAQLIRLKPDLTTEIISFDAGRVLQGIDDIKLIREDRVIISSIFDLKDEFTVFIQGEVRLPGSYRYVDSISLKDLILQAGGFTDAAFPQRIEIARLIRRDTLTALDNRLSEIISVQNVDDLTLGIQNTSLQPFDVVTIRRLPGYLGLQSVSVTGQVQYPGPYVLSNRAERISDLLKRSGGLAPEAFAAGAFLKRIRERNVTTEIDSAKVDKIQKQLKDSSGQVVASVARLFDQIPLNLISIMTHPGADMDLILKPGDELFIPRNDEEIKITGEVLYPTQAAYNQRNNLRNYIGDAGGFTDNARKNKVYALYPNGQAAKTSHFLFFRRYPEIKPGTEIIVPTYSPREKRRGNVAETLGIASAVASLAGVIIAIVQLVK